MFSFIFHSPELLEHISKLLGVAGIVLYKLCLDKRRNGMCSVTTHLEHNKHEFEQNTFKLSSVISFFSEQEAALGYGTCWGSSSPST